MVPNIRIPLQVNSEALKKACPIPYHEGRLWKSADAADLKLQLQAHFHNMTSIMDCVGCEKCKLWGKLQLMGAHPSPAPGHPGLVTSNLASDM